jgi:hypothetical protein
LKDFFRHCGLQKSASIDAGNANTAKNEQICRYLNGPNAQWRWIPDEERTRFWM